MTMEAVIFDVDGTLAETEEIHRRAFNEAFAASGLDWHWDRSLYADLLQVTGGKERIRHYATNHPAEGWIRDEPSASSRIAELHRAKTARYTALVEADGIGLRPGVGRLVRQARAEGVRLAVATTSSLPNVMSLLAMTLGADGPGLFDVIAAGDMAARKKPAPDIYALALDRLGLPAHACVAIEDSFNGVMAARRAGLPVLATTSTYTRLEDLRYAFAILSDLGEPDAPFRHLGGAGAGETCVTTDILDRWRRACLSLR
jgi:HAD superfamily hydrolase (TIGR01509 family)